eukprot:scaffold7724_cov27-Tisochrysis_lutea.AAC.5
MPSIEGSWTSEAWRAMRSVPIASRISSGSIAFVPAARRTSSSARPSAAPSASAALATVRREWPERAGPRPSCSEAQSRGRLYSAEPSNELRTVFSCESSARSSAASKCGVSDASVGRRTSPDDPRPASHRMRGLSSCGGACSSRASSCRAASACRWGEYGSGEMIFRAEEEKDLLVESGSCCGGCGGAKWSGSEECSMPRSPLAEAWDHVADVEKEW